MKLFKNLKKFIKTNHVIAVLGLLVLLVAISQFSTRKSNITDNMNSEVASSSLNSQLVIYFRIFAIIMSHWVPLLTLPRFIDMQSILTLIALGIFYIGLLYLQGFSVYNVYGSELSNVKRINSLYHLFKLRYGSVPMGFIGFGFLFYTGYLLLKNPAKGSLLYKVF